MKTVAVFSTAIAMFVGACGSSFSPTPSLVSKVYVLVPSPKAASFTTELASIAKKHGMHSVVGQATDDKGDVLQVLDAERDGLRLRSENVLLSGQEDPLQCGVHTEPHSDAGQFFISISASGDETARQAAQRLLLNVGEDLKASGYDVRAAPVICSASTKR